MSESAERVALPCPSCTPAFETVHEVLSEGGGRATVRCTECGHVHKERLPEEETVERDVVVSQEGESFAATVEAPAEESVATGEEFVLETDEAILEVRITSLEVGPEQRVEQAPVREVETIWTRGVGNVAVPVTVNPDDGRHDDTESVTVRVPGDYEFTVGEDESFGDDEFSVTAIRLRDDAHGYEHDQLDHDGDTARAKDVARLYGRDESDSAWSAW